MSNTVFHAHIGVHDVFPLLLSIASTELSGQLRRAAVHFVSREQLRDEVRPSLLDHGKARDLTGAEGSARVILSDHAILCRREKVYSARSGLYSSIAPALERLSAFFEGEELVLHLTLPPQSDYSLISDAVAGSREDVSWVGLVRQIAERFPRAKINLWPIERREKDGLRFVEGVLGVTPDAAMKLKIMRMASEQRAWEPKGPVDPVAHVSAYLDDAFHSDLDALYRLDNVSFAIRAP